MKSYLEGFFFKGKNLEVNQYQLQHRHSFHKVDCQLMKLSVEKFFKFPNWSSQKTSQKIITELLVQIKPVLST